MTLASATSGFSRRALLKGGLASVALVALGGVGLLLQRSRLRAMPKGGLQILTLTEYSVLAAIAERLLPAAAAADPSAGTAAVPGTQAIDVALLADRLLATVDADVAQGVKLGLSIVESGLAGAVLVERTTPFTQLSNPAQDAALLALRQSRLPLRRTLYRSFAGLTGSLYYGDPRAWPSIGYPGTPDPQGLRKAYAAQLIDYAALRKRSG